MIMVLKKIWFDKVDTLHIILYKPEYCWWRDNNYTEKLIKILSQTTYNFSKFRGSWKIIKHCNWSSNINQSIV